MLCSRVNLRQNLFRSFSPEDALELPDDEDDDDAKVEERDNELDASESTRTRCTSRSGSWKEECTMLHPKQKKLEVELNQARLMRPCVSGRRTVR